MGTSSETPTEHALDPDGLYQVTSLRRSGWGWRCLCGWRSPLYESPTEAGEAFKEHAASPPPRRSRRTRRERKHWQKRDRRQN